MENKNFDFIIIGAGPAGIFAALEMAQKRPQSRVLIVDTGRAISHRACPARIDGQCKHCDPCAIVLAGRARARSRTASCPSATRWAAM